MGFSADVLKATPGSITPLSGWVSASQPLKSHEKRMNELTSLHEPLKPRASHEPGHRCRASNETTNSNSISNYRTKVSENQFATECNKWRWLIRKKPISHRTALNWLIGRTHVTRCNKDMRFCSGRVMCEIRRLLSVYNLRLNAVTKAYKSRDKSRHLSQFPLASLQSPRE